MIGKILDIINEIRADKGENCVATIEEKTLLRQDLGFDSMDLAFLTAKIDEEYGIDVFEDGIVDTVGEIIKKLT